MTGLHAAAVAYAQRGWPVFPCAPGSKMPAIPKAEGGNGFHDATTNFAQIRAWWTRWPDANIGIATGAPAVDVLDVDVRPGGSGHAALNRLTRGGLTAGASAVVRTRSGGLHLYYEGTDQRCGKLAAFFLDFKAAGGYVLAPPSWVDEDDKGPAGVYELVEERDAHGRLDWSAVCRLLDPPTRRRQFRQPICYRANSFGAIVTYLSGLKDGDQRWRQLHWAACRAAEYIAAGQLAETEARYALMEASRVNGFIDDHGEAQAIRKIDRGLSQEARRAAS